MLVPHMGLKEGGARFSPSIVVAVPVVVLVAVLVVCIIPSVYGTPLDSNSIASVHKSFLHKLDCNTMSSSCISSMGRVVAVVVVVLVAVLVVVLVVESISASSNSA
jgi:L-lactate permease